MTDNNLKPTFFATPSDFRAWLEQNHDKFDELWVGFYKKATGLPTISYTEAVDQALCFGWIDGLKNKHDDISYKLRFTPRKPKSIWSKTNVANVERLIKTGQMTPAGLTKVEAAKADGRWEAAYHGASTMTIPAELQQFLDTHPQPKAYFESLTAANRYAILFRLTTAVKPEARAKRLEQITQMLIEGRSFHSGLN